MGEEAENNKNFEEFMLHTEAMLVANPTCKEAWELRVRAFKFEFKANKLDDAFQAAIQAAQLGSTIVAVWVTVGEGYMVRSDYQNALGAFERASELESHRKNKAHIIGKIKHAKKMQAASEKLLEGEEKEEDIGTCFSNDDETPLACDVGVTNETPPICASSSKDSETHIGHDRELEKISTSEVSGEIADDDILLPSSSSKILDEDITKVDSYSESPLKYVEFLVGVHFSINKVDKGGLYDGYIYHADDCTLRTEVSFISFGDSGYAFDASKALLPFKLGHQNILRFEQLIDAKCIPNMEGFTKNDAKILVVERVIHLDHFFEAKCRQFREQNSIGDESDWMKFINEDLKRIFRDVVRAMIFLIGKDKWLGDFDSGIYVTPNGHGKIIPFAHNWKGVATDIDDLRLKMEKIIRGDFSSDIRSVSRVRTEIDLWVDAEKLWGLSCIGKDLIYSVNKLSIVVLVVMSK